MQMLARNIAYALLLSSLLLLHLAAYSINGTPVFASVGSADKTQNNQKEKSHGGPLIRSVQPSVGSVLGGTDVIVKGKHFRQGAILTIGGIDAAGVLVNSKTIKGKVGPHPAGVVDVIVTNADGRSGKLSSAFTFRNIFSDVSLKAGVDVKLERGDFKIPLGGGVAVGDYNKDGLIDIYVTNSAGPNALLRNNGDMTFVNVASETGVDHPEGRSNGACFADYDNDGNLDLLVTGYGTTTLYHNTGHGTFTNANTLTGISDPDSSYRTMGCAWGDYDRDGFLDLIMVRHFDESDLSFMITHDFAPAVRPLSLYHNNGDGTFRDTTSLLGNNAVYPSNIKGASYQPVFFDYNNDGFPDIYVV